MEKKTAACAAVGAFAALALPATPAHAVVAGDIIPATSTKSISASADAGTDSGGKIYPVGYAAARVGFGWGLVGYEW